MHSRPRTPLHRLVLIALIASLGSACTSIPGTHCNELSNIRRELEGLTAEVEATGPIAEGDELDLATGDLLARLAAFARNDGDPILGREVHDLSRAYDDFDRPAVRLHLAEVRSLLATMADEDCLGE